MKQRVFILATIRNPELAPYTELVFKTLRVGFPTAKVEVHLNKNEGDEPKFDRVTELAKKAGCAMRGFIKETTHHLWIESLIESYDDDFWILDTDVIFYQPVEHWTFDTPLAGMLIPEFCDEFTKSVTRSRLHTSLMHIRPKELKDAWLKYELLHPRTTYNPPANPVHPLYMPLNGSTYFYDTLAMAYHAIGGTPFTTRQKDAYFHFHFGTFSDLVLPELTYNMAGPRAAVLANPADGIGLWRQQEDYFNARQFAQDGTDVVAPIDPKDAQEAHKWNVELCCGDLSAMAFNDLYYRYCHAIDDLLDTMRDGRPRMSKDQILSIFFNAALLYNSSFFVAHREMLFPIILDITTNYAVSVGWEQSSKEHLRKMADVFRTCGNRLYHTVALLCGGEQHALRMIRKIHERDYLGQHDKDGNPA